MQSMTTGLLEQFLAEEATDHVRREIASAVIEARMNASTAVRTFELNRFELVLRFATEEVEINDVLDASSNGSAQMTLGLFLKALDQ